MEQAVAVSENQINWWIANVLESAVGLPDLRGAMLEISPKHAWLPSIREGHSIGWKPVNFCGNAFAVAKDIMTRPEFKGVLQNPSQPGQYSSTVGDAIAFSADPIMAICVAFYKFTGGEINERTAGL